MSGYTLDPGIYREIRCANCGTKPLLVEANGGCDCCGHEVRIQSEKPKIRR